MDMDAAIHPSVWSRVAYRAMDRNFHDETYKLFLDRYAEGVADGTLLPVEELFTVQNVSLTNWVGVLNIGVECWQEEFPLLLMRETGIESMGVSGAYVCVAPNMRSVLSGFALHYPNFDPNLTVGLSATKGGLVFSLVYNGLQGWLGACFNASAVSLLLTCLTAVSGLRQGDGHRLRLFCPKPSSGHLYEKQIACPVEWGDNPDKKLGLEMFLPDHLIDRRNPTFDEGMYNYISDMLWEQTSKLAEIREGATTWSSMTRLRLSSSTTLPTQQQMADSLQLSTRSLQKHLKGEGTSWQALADKEVMKRATMMLAGGDTVEAVAAAMGMTAGNFRRKFKAITGHTPKDYLAKND